MKWLRNRLEFLNERERAKIKEVIFPKQAQQLSKKWGNSYLELEEVTPTDKIKQGKWKLSDDDKFAVLEEFLLVGDRNLKMIMDWHKNLPEHFIKIANESIDKSIKSGFLNVSKKDFEKFDIKNVTLDQLYWFGEPIFTKISVNETKSKSYIVRDDNDVPIMDENGTIIRKEKESGDIIWSKSTYSFSSFVTDYNRCFDAVTLPDIDRTMSKIRDLLKDLKDNSQSYKIFESIFDKDLYLSIKHNPKDILNMSISKFYSSCQDLYSGSHNRYLLSNVFDPNSIPAFLIFDVPIYMDGGIKISDQLPICRRMIRSIEKYGKGISEETKLYFDRTYPDRLEKLFGKIIEKYSGNIPTTGLVTNYLFAPDLTGDLDSPYMDRLDTDNSITIGKNVKEVTIGWGGDWNKYLWPKKVNLELLSIETDSLPENFFRCEIKTKDLKFVRMDLYKLDLFDFISFETLQIDKCKISSEAIRKICEGKPKKVSFTSTKLEGSFNGFVFEELELMYTIKSKQLIETLNGVKTNKLILSSDLLQIEENKDFINELKNQGVKVEIKGPKI